jgi:hypothetical protein
MHFHIDQLTVRNLATVFVVSLVWHSGDKLVGFLAPTETLPHRPAQVAESKPIGGQPDGTYGGYPDGKYKGVPNAGRYDYGSGSGGYDYGVDSGSYDIQPKSKSLVPTAPKTKRSGYDTGWGSGTTLVKFDSSWDSGSYVSAPQRN